MSYTPRRRYTTLPLAAESVKVFAESMQAQRPSRYTGKPSIEKHLSEFIEAWEVEKAPSQIPPGWDGNIPDVPVPENCEAFDWLRQAVYFQKLSELLHIWRTEPPVITEKANIAALWCEQHKEIFAIIQHGMFKQRQMLWVEHNQNGIPEFVTHDLAEPENSWVMTERTAAYVRMGAFLTGEPERMGFCEFCEKPFLKHAQKRKYCSGKCAHRGANESSRQQKLGMKERKRLVEAAKCLGKWLEKPSHHAGAIWWKELQADTGLANEHGFQTKDCRRSRTLKAYILAAQTPLESPERAKLFAKLSAGLGKVSEREALQQKLDGFLDAIKKAEDAAKSSHV